MSIELKYTTFNTVIGWIGILASAKGLLSTTLPQHSVQEALKLLGDRVNNAIPSAHQFDGLIERLRIYLSDEETTSLAGSFRQQSITLIPYSNREANPDSSIRYFPS